MKRVSVKARSVEINSVEPIILMSLSNTLYLPNTSTTKQIINRTMVVINVPFSMSELIQNRLSKNPAVTAPTAAVTKNIDAIVITK